MISSKINYKFTKFSISVPDIHHLPPDVGIELAFAGRSNSGKSSLLNYITNKKKLARVSKTPGNTQMINFFQVSKEKYLVDLPGYGYANTSKKTKLNCQSVLNEYLQKRKALRGLIIAMDIRYPLTMLDKCIIKLAIKRNIKILLLLTKSDKINISSRNIQLKLVTTILTKYTYDINIEIYSSLDKTNSDKIHYYLNQWFNYL